MKETLRDIDRQLSFTDLTAREIFSLLKDYLLALFVCLLIFALPWALLSGLDLGLKSTLPEESYSLWSNIINYGLLALIAYLILTNASEFLQNLGEMFINLGRMATKMSRMAQLLFMLFLVGYFSAWVKYPSVAFFFSILVLMPAGFTYDQYQKLIRSKSNNQ